MSTAFKRPATRKAISLHEAKGILIAGLGVLARYYGHDLSGSARSRHPQRNSAVP